MKNLLRFRVKALMLTAIFLIGIAGMLSAQKIAIIDAGSSGSVLYVYEWNKIDKKLSLLYPEPDKQSDTKKAILAEVNHTDEAAKVYLDSMTRKYSNPDCGGLIPLYVLATAGMRGKDTLIYGKIRSVSKINGYKIEKAMTISGEYEGFCAWIAANYKNKNLGFNNSTPEQPLTYAAPTCGILEIGGASIQITFAMDEQCPDCISRKGFSNIYSKSYLGCGVNSVFGKYNNDTDPSNFKALNMDLNTVKGLIPKNLSFFGLGGSIRAFFKEGKTLDEYSDFYKDSIPSATNHPYMNGKYIKYITTSLGLVLNSTFKDPKNPSNWTEGAALDILLYGETPDEYTDSN